MFILRSKAVLFLLLLLVSPSFRVLPAKADYGIPDNLASDPLERASEYLEGASAVVSSWTVYSLEEFYVDLDDCYDYYEDNGGGTQFVSTVRDTMTSLTGLGITIGHESLDIIHDGWETISRIKDVDLTLVEFDEYLLNELLDYPTNEWMQEDVVSEIVKEIFTHDYLVDFGAYIDVAEEVRSDIENGVPVGDALFGATIEILEYKHLGEYDPVTRVFTIGLTDERLGKAVLVWDNGVMAIDVSDVALLPIDLKAKVEPDLEAGCVKIDVDEAMIDLATIPLVDLILDVDIKAGFSGEVVLTPDPETSIDQQIQVSLKGVYADGGITTFGIPIAKADLRYYVEEDTISACAEAGGEPVWAYYDTSSNTWTAMQCYFEEGEQYGGYLGTWTDHLSIFTIMSSTDPVLTPSPSLWVILLVTGISTVAVATVLGIVLYRRKRKLIEGKPLPAGPESNQIV